MKRKTLNDLAWPQDNDIEVITSTKKVSHSLNNGGNVDAQRVSFMNGSLYKVVAAKYFFEASSCWPVSKSISAVHNDKFAASTLLETSHTQTAYMLGAVQGFKDDKQPKSFRCTVETLGNFQVWCAP
eukprot:5381363-Amphidinium_carterae.1